MKKWLTHWLKSSDQCQALITMLHDSGVMQESRCTRNLFIIWICRNLVRKEPLHTKSSHRAWLECGQTGDHPPLSRPYSTSSISSWISLFHQKNKHFPDPFNFHSRSVHFVHKLCLVLGPAPAWGHHPLPVLGEAPLPEKGRVRLDHLPRPDQRPDLLHHPLGHLPLGLGQVHRLVGILLQVKQEHQVRGGCLIHGLGVGFPRPLPDIMKYIEWDEMMMPEFLKIISTCVNHLKPNFKLWYPSVGRWGRQKEIFLHLTFNACLFV